MLSLLLRMAVKDLTKESGHTHNQSLEIHYILLWPLNRLDLEVRKEKRRKEKKSGVNSCKNEEKYQETGSLFFLKRVAL